ncbi:MAG: DEAD/DEAH box helicase, partial [Alistipes sp.]|nr:DEAD/DEAH box helicase [Alistipes sp.]
RGIDIEDIGLVINYDVPHDPEDYIHRIGRTARAAATGSAITFVSVEEQSKFHQIEKFIEREIPKRELPAEVGEGPAYNPSDGRGGRGGRGGKGRGSRKGKSKDAKPAAPKSEAAATPDNKHAEGRGEGNRGSRDRRRRHHRRRKGGANQTPATNETPNA